MNPFIENMNYLNDQRNTTKPDDCVLHTEEGDVELPTKWEICPLCNGEGRHVNPSIDSNGLTAEDFYEDPDFAEEYLSGMYDQTCNCCHGRTTVKVVDLDACSPEQREAYIQQQQAIAQEECEARAQRMYGY